MGTMVTCALNGCGRIGRLVFRYAWDDPLLDVVHINDVCSCESAAYLLQFDSVHGTWDKKVEATADGRGLTVDGKLVTFSKEADFAKVDWQGKGVEMVMECTGKFLKVKELDAYFAQCGVQRVVVSAPVKEGALNVVLGCNHHLLRDERKLVTNASCTTNCLAPVVRVMQEQFGIKHGCITTVHDVTATQTLVDMPNTKKSDLRVPLLNASLTDCVFEIEKEGGVTAEEVNAAFKKASEEGPLKGLLGYETRPLVSTDYTNDTRSCIVDALSTQVIDGSMVKVYAWYDNECGYSKRMAELCHIVAAKYIAGVEPEFKYE